MQAAADYLKYDNCDNLNKPPLGRQGLLRNALHEPVGRSSTASAPGARSRHGPGRRRSPTLWRTHRDIKDSWSSLLDIIKTNERLARFARPGHWNDPDQLEVGNAGLTSVEQRTQISLWAMTAAPLLISTDLRHVSASALNLLGNRQVIALDQDPLGRQARVVRSSADSPRLSIKPLADGRGRSPSSTRQRAIRN